MHGENDTNHMNLDKLQTIENKKFVETLKTPYSFGTKGKIDRMVKTKFVEKYVQNYSMK